MDFYVDLATAVVLRLLKDRRNAAQYHGALAKLFIALLDYSNVDAAFARVVQEKRGEA